MVWKRGKGGNLHLLLATITEQRWWLATVAINHLQCSPVMPSPVLQPPFTPCLRWPQWLTWWWGRAMSHSCFTCWLITWMTHTFFYYTLETKTSWNIFKKNLKKLRVFFFQALKTICTDKTHKNASEQVSNHGSTDQIIKCKSVEEEPPALHGHHKRELLEYSNHLK